MQLPRKYLLSNDLETSNRHLALYLRVGLPRTLRTTGARSLHQTGLHPIPLRT